MDKSFGEDGPPSYQETIASSTRQSLTQQVTTSRSQHVQTVILTLIIPILEHRASRGLSKTTIALVPTIPSGNIASEQSSISDKKSTQELIGLADSDESFEEVRLEGHLNNPEFWRQEEALEDLQGLLQNSIASPEFYEPEEQNLPAQPSKKPSRNLFGRKASPIESQNSAQVTGRPKIKVDVMREDICYRVESEFGLYETVAKSAIVVRVDTRG